MNEEEHKMSPWNSAYYRTTASAPPNYEYLRERDLSEMYKLIEKENFSPLKHIRKFKDESILKARGTCTIEQAKEDEFYNELAEEKDEKEEEFLFDPKELDI